MEMRLLGDRRRRPLGEGRRTSQCSSARAGSAGVRYGMAQDSRLDLTQPGRPVTRNLCDSGQSESSVMGRTDRPVARLGGQRCDRTE